MGGQDATGAQRGNRRCSLASKKRATPVTVVLLLWAWEIALGGEPPLVLNPAPRDLSWQCVVVLTEPRRVPCQFTKPRLRRNMAFARFSRRSSSRRGCLFPAGTVKGVRNLFKKGCRGRDGPFGPPPRGSVREELPHTAVALGALRGGVGWGHRFPPCR